MTDSYIKVLESQDSDAKQVDNDAVDYTGTTRYRQRIAVPDGADVTQGAVGDAAWSSGDGTVVSLLKKLAGLLAGTLTVNASGNAVPVTDNSGSLTVDDGAGSLTVDGTVTANAGSGPWPVTDNGGSLTVDGSVTVTQGTATNLKVDASGVAVPITDNAGSITVDGTFWQATQPTSVADGSSVALGAVADAAWSSGNGTVISLLKKLAGLLAGTLTVNASGNAVPVTDNSGSLTVDNGGTFVVQDNQVVADNAGFTDGTTKVFMAGLIYDESAGTALTENDAAAARIDVKRATVSVIEDETTRGRRATVTAGNALKVDASGVAVPITDNSGSLTVDQGTATNLLGVHYNTTDILYNATTALTPKFAKIAVSSSGVNIVVAAVTSKKIRVLSYVLVANAAVNAKWQSHTTPTDLTGLLYLAANGGVSAAFSQFGHFESLSGESLDINLSGAQAVGGHLVYVEV